MDDMEKKEELEQEVQEPVAEEVEEAAEETAKDVPETEEIEEAAEEVTEDMPAEEVSVKKAAEKDGSNIISIIIGLAAFIALLAFCWMSPVGNSVKDSGVFYAKDNDLYFYDMKNEPYLVQEDIAKGGGYHYFYSAWGAGVAEEGDWAYYMANIDASGAADLYRMDVKDASAEAELVDSNVYDYMASKDGEVVAYLAMVDDSLQLRTFDGKSSNTVAEGMHLEDDVYSLSGDGKYLVYKDAYDMLCAAEVKDGADAMALTDDSPLYTLAEDTGILYFVSKADDVYNIFSYDFKEEPVLVAENASYMELMPNGRDLLYGVKPTEIIPYSEILVDDMAEIDAAMTEDDENYELKLMRDDIRAAMESGEGIEPLLLEYYLLSGGKATLVVENVVSGVAVAGSDRNFVAGYKAKDFQPIYLSVIGGGLDMVEMIYYMSINYGGLQPFLADGFGNVEVLDGSGVLLNTVQVSADGSRAAYLVEDPDTGSNTLMQIKVGQDATKEFTVVQENVKEFAFVGGNGPLCYYYDYADGAGTLSSMESDRAITGATGVHFAEDTKAVYYIRDIDSTTGVGQMQHWDGKGEPVIVDGGVFAFQYKGNGKAAIVYQYDVAKQVGDLGYYDGKGVTMLDEDITALFIY